MLIIVTTISICLARWAAVFPLSRLINWVHRMRSNGQSLPDEIPYQYQMMTFWAGLRGAVGVALAMGLQGEFKSTLLATVLVVVVLTVILFGGTTAGMLEVLNIKTGCVDEDESDDEFDIEAPKAITTNSVLANRRFNKSTPAVPFSDIRNRSSPNINPQEDLLRDDDAPTDLDEIPPLMPVSVNPMERSSTSIVGTVQSILHTDDRARWFQNFDEQVLKPVLLDVDPSKNNRNGSPPN